MKAVDDCKAEISTFPLNFHLIPFLSCKQNEDLPRISREWFTGKRIQGIFEGYYEKAKLYNYGLKAGTPLMYMVKSDSTIQKVGGF